MSIHAIGLRLHRLLDCRLSTLDLCCVAEQMQLYKRLHVDCKLSDDYQVPRPKRRFGMEIHPRLPSVQFDPLEWGVEVDKWRKGRALLKLSMER